MLPKIDLYEPLLLQSYVVLFFITLILCVVIILSTGYGFSRRPTLDENAIQSAHTGFVPRVGGIALFISISALIPLLTFGFVPLSIIFNLDTKEIICLILSSIPVFLAGIAEDLGYSVPPRRRLLASTLSSLMALILLQVWVVKLGIPIIDDLFFYAIVGIAFTIFATVGVVNGFNLIDGLNGLSSYVTISCATSLSILAYMLADIQTTVFLTLLIASVLGFMVLNFPFGKIFLGDGGAYILGHLLVWSSILLINRIPEISPFCILLIFFWPIADTILAIWRRWALGNPADRPDRLHFHQLAMRLIEIRFFGRERRSFANPVATIILVPLISTPQLLGLIYWNDVIVTIWITVCAGFLFVIIYLLGVKLAKKSRTFNFKNY